MPKKNTYYNILKTARKCKTPTIFSNKKIQNDGIITFLWSENKARKYKKHWFRTLKQIVNLQLFLDTLFSFPPNIYKQKRKVDLTRTLEYGIILANKIEKDFVARLERSPTKFVKIHKTVLIFDNQATLPCSSFLLGAGTVPLIYNRGRRTKASPFPSTVRKERDRRKRTSEHDMSCFVKRHKEHGKRYSSQFDGT